MEKEMFRRQFLQYAAIGAAGFLTVKSPAARQIPVKKQDGLVFLFQGDSITDGNRGRTEDPNHIMGHGYAFAIASRIGADFPSSNFKFYNRGVSGNTVLDLKNRW